jgi:hypothetical protein
MSQWTGSDAGEEADAASVWDRRATGRDNGLARLDLFKDGDRGMAGVTKGKRIGPARHRALGYFMRWNNL